MNRLVKNEQDHDFSNKIILSDEAHFHLSGYVNKQNCRIWGSENPREMVEQPLHPQRVTVWCGFWSGGVIGPYFFENDAGATVSVNGLRYRTMLTDFFWPEIDAMDVDDVYFQQDGATCLLSSTHRFFKVSGSEKCFYSSYFGIAVFI